jgi:hypothetical protein
MSSITASIFEPVLRVGVEGVNLIDRAQIPDSFSPPERLLLTLPAAGDYLSRRALLIGAPPSTQTEYDFLEPSTAEHSAFLSSWISTSPPAGDPLSTVGALPTGIPHSIVGALLANNPQRNPCR